VGRAYGQANGRANGAANGQANVTHGHARSTGRHPLYKTWEGMNRRCTSLNDTAYQRYGDRGIRVCDRWRDFAAFIADMGEKPSRTHSLDRINNDGNYEPGNVRWATPKEQAQNRRQR
jgi:hypothetical protein